MRSGSRVEKSLVPRLLAAAGWSPTIVSKDFRVNNGKYIFVVTDNTIIPIQLSRIKQLWMFYLPPKVI